MPTPSASHHLRLEKAIARYAQANGSGATPVPGLMVAYLTQPLAPTSHMLEPSFCLGVRGTKRIRVDEQCYEYGEGDFLLTAIGLPTITEVQHATPQQPYAALVVSLDLDATRVLAAEIDHVGVPVPAEDPAIAIAPVDLNLLDAATRLVELLDRPDDIPIIGRLLQQELLYRLLKSPVGPRLRRYAHLGSHEDRVAKAAAWLRQNFNKRVRMEELATMSGMSLSTFNRRFQKMTDYSPLQYQKQVRLHEARRLLLSNGVDVATAAYRVGYESDTQFSREYRRLFGEPPKRDIRLLRSA